MNHNKQDHPYTLGEGGAVNISCHEHYKSNIWSNVSGWVSYRGNKGPEMSILCYGRLLCEHNLALFEIKRCSKHTYARLKNHNQIWLNQDLFNPWSLLSWPWPTLLVTPAAPPLSWRGEQKRDPQTSRHLLPPLGLSLDAAGNLEGKIYIFLDPFIPLTWRVMCPLWSWSLIFLIDMFTCLCPCLLCDSEQVVWEGRLMLVVKLCSVVMLFPWRMRRRKETDSRWICEKYHRVRLGELRMLKMLFDDRWQPRGTSKTLYPSHAHSHIFTPHTYSKYTVNTLVFDVVVSDRAVPSRSSSASIIEITF